MDDSTPTFRLSRTLCSIETGAAHSFSFDRSGCLVRAAWDGHMARWGLDGGALLKTLSKPGVVSERRSLGPAEGLALAATACSRAQELLARSPSPPAPWDMVMQQVAAVGVLPTERRAARFAQVYSRVGILPPDQYGALLLQLTVGCRWNRCAFCTFYKECAYQVKAAAEFAQHIRAVLHMLGPAVNRRYSVFLGDAGALNLPFAQVAQACEQIADLLPPHNSGSWPIYSFMDAFSGGPQKAAEFAQLARRGLRRVYVGVESGSDELLKLMRKPASFAQMISRLKAIKEGGVALGPVILLGAGGKEYADAHEAASAELLAGLPLDSSDTIFFSDLQIDPLSPYAAWAEVNGIRQLSVTEMRAQEKRIRRFLRSYTEGGPRVTRYHVDEFVYY